MQDFVYSLASAMGVPDAMAKFLSSTGLSGLVLILVWACYKLAWGPFKEWYKIRSMRTDTVINLLSNIEKTMVAQTATMQENNENEKAERQETTRKIDHVLVRVDKLDEMVKSIMSGSVGTVMEREAVREFMSLVDKAHSQMLVEYVIRCEQDKILLDPALSAKRYRDHAEVVSSKVLHMLSQHLYEGVRPLSAFFCEAGASSYFRHAGNAFYSLQYLKADADTQAVSVTMDDCQRAVDRSLSRLTNLFREWLKDSSRTYTSVAFKDKAHFDIKFIGMSDEEAEGDVELL